jgi:7,8-dihydroneopterin 2',3'-cyclic phosphate phosphodiesterase
LVKLINPRFEKILNRIRDGNLRAKVAQILKNPTLKIKDEAFSGPSLEDSPAALWQHHTYRGGLVEHVEATAEIALTLCKVIKKVYGGEVNRDIVLAGILLHDVFKPLTYTLKDDGSFGSSSLGERLDHLSLIVSELIRKGFPLEVVHAVCAHHGEYGPIKPKSVEALVCFLADYMDSQLNGEVLRAAKYIVKEAIGEELKELTAREAFKIIHLKNAEGLNRVRRFLRRERVG